MELDKEEILNELMNFEKNYGRDTENGLPECLEKLLINIAKSGDIIYPWNKIKPVVLKKIELVVNEFNTKYPYENNPVLPNVKPFNFQEMKDEIIEKFDYFYGAPFTIQRICELLTAPYKHYKRADKFMRGLEKNVRVISTIEARRSDKDKELNSFQREFSRSPQNNSSSPSSSASSSNILSSPLPSSSSSPSPSSSSASSSASSSSSIASSSASSSAFMNGLNDKEEPSSQTVLCSSQMSQSCSPLQDPGPAPLQQLDSFTTVFASPPSTPLAVVHDMHPYDAGSPSSSSSSSSESSPQPSSSSSPPPSLTTDAHELNQSIDAEFVDSKLKESNADNSGNLSDSTKSDDEHIDIMEQEEPMDQMDEDKFEEAHDELEDESIKSDAPELVKDNPDEENASTSSDVIKEAVDDQYQASETKTSLELNSSANGTESIAVNENLINPSSDAETSQKPLGDDTKCQEPGELAETTGELLEKNKVSSIETPENTTVETTTPISGQKEQFEIEASNSNNDVQDSSNEQIKAESKDSLTGNQELASSESSPTSEEPTDVNVTLSNEQSNVIEKPESQ